MESSRPWHPHRRTWPTPRSSATRCEQDDGILARAIRERQVEDDAVPPEEYVCDMSWLGSRDELGEEPSPFEAAFKLGMEPGRRTPQAAAGCLATPSS